MKIVKYEKKANGKYKIVLENNEKVDTYENVILKNNILYKTELDSSMYKKILNDNEFENNYLKCVKLISYRYRSTYEIKKYLEQNKISDEKIFKIIKKLEENNLLNDKRFAISFVHDKFMLTTMGIKLIKYKLKQHQISNDIIEIAVNEISDSQIEAKIDKIISKELKNKSKNNFKNKLFTKLLNLGYDYDIINKKINEIEK